MLHVGSGGWLTGSPPPCMLPDPGSASHLPELVCSSAKWARSLVPAVSLCPHTQLQGMLFCFSLTESNFYFELLFRRVAEITSSQVRVPLPFVVGPHLKSSRIT